MSFGLGENAPERLQPSQAAEGNLWNSQLFYFGLAPDSEDILDSKAFKGSCMSALEQLTVIG